MFKIKKVYSYICKNCSKKRQTTDEDCYNGGLCSKCKSLVINPDQIKLFNDNEYARNK